jgi:hypothetical protein
MQMRKTGGEMIPQIKKILYATEFARLAKDPRLTEAENAILVERLSEMREALAELLIKKRQKSHDRDFVAG